MQPKTKKEYDNLRKGLNRALKDEKESFIANGKEYVPAYAKVVLDFVKRDKLPN